MHGWPEFWLLGLAMETQQKKGVQLFFEMWTSHFQCVEIHRNTPW
jgi:quinol monooxygenase YgiN